MGKETLSNKQAISIMVLFLSGTSSASLFGIAAGKDVWLAIILAVLGSLVTSLIFARVQYNLPGKNLFDILEICFGKLAGRLLAVVVTLFLLQQTIDVLSNLTFFIQTVTLPETPRTANAIIIMFLCLWVAKEGIEVLGRWAEFFIPLYVIALVVTVILLFPKMEFDNIRPILYNGIKPVLKGAFYTFSFPFGEIIILSAIISSFQTRNSPYKIYTASLLIAGTLVLVVSLTDILVLGVDIAEQFYYPSYAAVAKIDIGQFLQRMEILAALVMMLGGFVKISIYVMASCKGIAKIFEARDYRFIVTPAVLLVISLSAFFHKGILKYTEWNNETWPYLAIPFQVMLPIIVLVVLEIKKTSKGSKNQE